MRESAIFSLLVAVVIQGCVEPPKPFPDGILPAEKVAVTGSGAIPSVEDVVNFEAILDQKYLTINWAIEKSYYLIADKTKPIFMNECEWSGNVKKNTVNEFYGKVDIARDGAILKCRNKYSSMSKKGQQWV
ncbi:MAG TPA: hypothetical protein VF268_13435, partial [Gammaproteobacteria bacterium]